MHYELAKELADAGFPQGGKGRYEFPVHIEKQASWSQTIRPLQYQETRAAMEGQR